MTWRAGVAVLAVLVGSTGCISLSAYEHDLAVARGDAKAAQAAQAAQAEGLWAALQAMQRALVAEAELRTVTVRALEAQLRRAESRAPADGGDLSSAREDLQRLREQERANGERLQRLEESMRQLIGRPAAGVTSAPAAPGASAGARGQPLFLSP